jgi:hypothetical protein
MLDGLLVAEPISGFVPVRLEPPSIETSHEVLARGASVVGVTCSASDTGIASPHSPVIAIELPAGLRLRVAEEVGATALPRILTALRGQFRATVGVSASGSTNCVGRSINTAAHQPKDYRTSSKTAPSRQIA